VTLSVTRLDQFTFHKVIGRTPDAGLVCFTAVGCGGCRRWNALPGPFGAARPRVHVFEMNAPEDTALTREFEVFHRPARFVFVNARFRRPVHREPGAPALARALEAP